MGIFNRLFPPAERFAVLHKDVGWQYVIETGAHEAMRVVNAEFGPGATHAVWLADIRSFHNLVERTADRFAALR